MLLSFSMSLSMRMMVQVVMMVNGVALLQPTI